MHGKDKSLPQDHLQPSPKRRQARPRDSNGNFLQRSTRFWKSRNSQDVNLEDIREICSNTAKLFSLLQKWADDQKLDDTETSDATAEPQDYSLPGPNRCDDPDCVDANVCVAKHRIPMDGKDGR